VNREEIPNLPSHVQVEKEPGRLTRYDPSSSQDSGFVDKSDFFVVLIRAHLFSLDRCRFLASNRTQFLFEETTLVLIAVSMTFPRAPLMMISLL